MSAVPPSSSTDQRAREVLQAEIVRAVTEEETPWS